MFKKEEEVSTNYKEAETIIGKSVKVKGNFHGDGNIVIEGEVEGSVKTNNYLLVGSKSKITASISAKNAKIGGQVQGNINIDGYLEIVASAKIDGDVLAAQISIEKGAVLNGQVKMSKQEEGHQK